MTLYPIAEEYRFVKALQGQGPIRAVKTGEKRPPRRGEWYLSGAIPEAYLAPSNLDWPSPILRLVEIIGPLEVVT